MKQFYHYNHSFKLESGEILPDITIAYHTFGKINAERNNVVWVMHALTADSNVEEWWPRTVAHDRFLDPDKWFVVCANVLGSCYGTTGPTSINKTTGQPYYHDFPDVTVRDMVKCHELLAKHLGISTIHTIIGSSLGGFQAIEWLVSNPEITEQAVLIATDFRCRPWLAAINKAMYMAIEADPTLKQRDPKAGAKGLAAARAIGLLSYRGQTAYDQTQDDTPGHDLFERKAHSYQAHQGQKLCDRFDAFSYLKMCRSTDSHDIRRGRGTTEDVLGRIKARCLIIAINSDILFPPSYHKEMAASVPHAEYHEIDSDFAHDGFLIENEKLNKIISDFYSRNDKITL